MKKKNKSIPVECKVSRLNLFIVSWNYKEIHFLSLFFQSLLIWENELFIKVPQWGPLNLTSISCAYNLVFKAIYLILTGFWAFFGELRTGVASCGVEEIKIIGR